MTMNLQTLASAIIYLNEDLLKQAEHAANQKFGGKDSLLKTLFKYTQYKKLGGKTRFVAADKPHMVVNEAKGALLIDKEQSQIVYYQNLAQLLANEDETLDELEVFFVGEHDKEMFEQLLGTDEDMLSQASKEDICSKFNEAVNMSVDEIKAWKEAGCTFASLTTLPTNRVLSLKAKAQKDWTDEDYAQARRVVRFVTKASKMKDGQNVSRDCPFSRRQVSLRNWGHKI